MNTDEKLLERFIHKHTVKVVTLLEKYNHSELADFLSRISPHQAGILTAKMDRYSTTMVFNKLDAKVAAAIIEQMSLPAAALLVKQLEEVHRRSILELLAPSLSAQISTLNQYPENSVASLAESDVFTLFDDLTVEQALAKLRINKLPVYPHIYVLNREQELAGLVTIEDLLKANVNERIQSVMLKNPLSIQVEMRVEHLLEGNLWDDAYLALPVVSNRNQFIGVIAKSKLSNLVQRTGARERQLNTAGKALGELYRIGFSSLLHSTASLPSSSK